MTDNVSRLPEPGVIFDLDTAEKPEKDRKDPFILKVGDRKITFADPADLDWQVLAAVDLPQDLIRASVSKEDREYLYEQEIPGWKFNQLMKAYYEHYDFEKKLAEARRQGLAGA